MLMWPFGALDLALLPPHEFRVCIEVAAESLRGGGG